MSILTQPVSLDSTPPAPKPSMNTALQDTGSVQAFWGHSPAPLPPGQGQLLRVLPEACVSLCSFCSCHGVDGGHGKAGPLLSRNAAASL